MDAHRWSGPSLIKENPLTLITLLVVVGLAAFITHVARLGFDDRRDHRRYLDELDRSGYYHPYTDVNRNLR